MSMNGELYRVSSTRLEELLASPDDIEAELYPDDYPENTRVNGCSVEKTWNAIDFILDYLAQQDLIPGVEPVTEGSSTQCVLHYGPVWYRTPAEVASIADTLSAIDRDKFRRGFAPDLMVEHHVYPDIWHEDDHESLFNYVWQHFAAMVEFYKSAKAGGDAVLLHLA